MERSRHCHWASDTFSDSAVDSIIEAKLSDDSSSDSASDSAPEDPSQIILGRHLMQQHSLNQSVRFDTASITESNGKMVALSSKGLSAGVHEWTIEILNCDVDIQEIGVCTVHDIEGIAVADGGVTKTTAFGARAVFGNELATDSMWYSSFNEDGGARCLKDLTKCQPIGWTSKDRLKVKLDLNRWRITFYLNGKKVRKVLSLKSKQTYYPFISFAGNCQYILD